MVSRYGLPMVVRHRVRPRDRRRDAGPALPVLRCASVSRGDPVWLAGGDPWNVQLAGNYFAAPPPTLLAFAPFTVLPADTAVALVALAVIGGAVATVRLLHLPVVVAAVPAPGPVRPVRQRPVAHRAVDPRATPARWR